ncbi:MAG: hypothetical protein WCY62_07235 [Clostridia bacterium]
MIYILTGQDYAVFLTLSGIRQSGISQAVFDAKTNNRTAVTHAKNELIKIGLGVKGKLSKAGAAITDAILDPQRVVSCISCNATDMATVHYSYKNGFWVRISPYRDHSLISIESPIMNTDIPKKIRRDILGDMDFVEGPGICLTLSGKEMLAYEVMHLAVIDKVRIKEAPLSKKEAAMSILEFVNKKNLLDLASSMIILGEEKGKAITKKLWDGEGVVRTIDSMVKKGVFDVLTEPETGKQKYLLSEMARKWLTADSLIDKITIQVLPEGTVKNMTVTRSGIMSVTQDGDNISFKSIDEADLQNIKEDELWKSI